jgi:CRP-like cAMP-binding protein
MDLAPIRGTSMLQGLTASHLDELGAIATEQQALEGQRLFKRGEVADTFYIVMDGVFALTVALRRLDAPVELGVEEKRPGDALGWSALVAPHDSTYSCYCTETGSVAAFPRNQLEAQLESDPELARRFLTNLARTVGDRVRALQNLWIDEIQQSMARINYWTHEKITSHISEALDAGRREH